LSGGEVDPVARITSIIVTKDHSLSGTGLSNEVKVEVEDALGAPLSGFPVNASVDNNAQIKQPSVILDANGTAIFEVTNNVAGEVIVSASVINSSTESVATNFDAVISGANVNEHSFGVNDGFPTTGGEGYNFSLEINGTTDFNNLYTWGSNHASATVNNGVVTIQSDDVVNAPVEIHFESPDGKVSGVYTFTINSWFVLYAGYVNKASAENGCISIGMSVPSLGMVTNSTPSGGTGPAASRGIGTLIGEWGNLNSFPPGDITWVWAREQYTSSPKRDYTVSVINGAISNDTVTNERRVICHK
ncbi:hypothetical protein I8I24_004786, partial [Enterobacter cloacae]|nr:hypothetical protein [Enterobacter cloacae]HCJ6523460.1 Ig-like domain-containing protein [Enterobacter cloacae]